LLPAPVVITSVEKKIDKEIMFLHLFTTVEICSASLVVENVQLFSDLSLMARKNRELNT
jgi:hypothetical protein